VGFSFAEIRAENQFYWFSTIPCFYECTKKNQTKNAAATIAGIRLMNIKAET